MTDSQIDQRMSDGGFVLAFLAVLTGAAIQTATGIGLALVSVPVLLFELPASGVVGTILGLNTALCAIVLAGDRGLVREVRLWPLLAGAILGTPFGVLGLLLSDPRLAQVIIGGGLFVSGIFIATRPPRPVPREGLGAAAAGFLSGLLNGGTGLSGPPIAIYLANQGWETRAMRGALLVTFLVSSVQGLGVLALAGRLSADSLIPAAMLLPAVVLGVVVVALGRRLTESLPAVISLPCESVLRRALGVIVVLGGLSGLVRGLLGGVVR